MNEETSLADISKLDVCITDLDFYEGLSEIINNLEYVYEKYNLHSMNDTAIRLYGEKNMLGEIIKYLKKIMPQED